MKIQKVKVTEIIVAPYNPRVALKKGDAEYEKLQTEIPELYNYGKAQIKRLMERQILDLLASRNVLPKYGFPVDVVQLKLQSTEEWARQIELDRDLKMALAEYAPGCTLVANGTRLDSLRPIKGGLNILSLGQIQHFCCDRIDALPLCHLAFLLPLFLVRPNLSRTF